MNRPADITPDEEKLSGSPFADKEPHDPCVSKISCPEDGDELWKYIENRLENDACGDCSEEPDEQREQIDMSKVCDEPPVLVREKCCVCGTEENVKRCGKCKLTAYCSKKCQKEHFPHHSQYCSVIVDLLKVETNKLFRDFSVRQAQVDFKTKRKMIKLVGEKPMLNCYFNGKQVEVLWDTGSMISIVDREWIERKFPGILVHPVNEFLEEGLQVRAANSTLINIDGVASFIHSFINIYL